MGRAILPAMRRFRVVLSVGGRKLTRHLRAPDRASAAAQAEVIGGVESRRVLGLGAGAVVLLSVEDRGSA